MDRTDCPSTHSRAPHLHDIHTPPPGPPPLLDTSQIRKLTKHGHLSLNLPSHLADQYTSLFAQSKDFFAQPTATKKSLYPPSQGTELGYTTLATEKEYLTFRHSVHASSPLETTIQSLWANTAALLHRILVDLSRSLDIAPYVWDPMLDGCMTMPTSLPEVTPSLLRVFRYEPDSGVADPHRDLGLLTLCVGLGKGLQTFTQTTGDGVGDGRTSEDGWEDAVGATLLVGDTFRVLSTGRVASGLHRVVGNPDGRSSIVFALRISTRHPINLTNFGGWGAVESMELWEEIRKSRVNVNARKDVREEQRARRAVANC